VPTPTPPPPEAIAVQESGAAAAVASNGTGAGTVSTGFGGAIVAASTDNVDVPAPTFTQSTAQPSAASALPLTAVSFVSGERRGLSLASQLVVDAEFAEFNVKAGGVPLSLQDVERSLRSPAMLEQLDRLREEIRKDLNLEQSVAITAAGATFGVSVIYVLWLIRGGVLMGSYLSALPAWQVLDPLPILERLKNPAEEEDDSFEEFENQRADPLNSLRGY